MSIKWLYTYFVSIMSRDEQSHSDDAFMKVRLCVCWCVRLFFSLLWIIWRLIIMYKNSVHCGFWYFQKKSESVFRWNGSSLKRKLHWHSIVPILWKPNAVWLLYYQESVLCMWSIVHYSFVCWISLSSGAPAQKSTKYQNTNPSLPPLLERTSSNAL